MAQMSCEKCKKVTSCEMNWDVRKITIIITVKCTECNTSVVREVTKRR